MSWPSRIGVCLALLLAACSFGNRVSTIESDGDRFVVNGVPNDPTGEVVEAGRLDTPLGEYTVETYPSRVGPCYTLVSPDGHRDAGCLETSGIEPHRPVTGRPGDSIEGLNGAAWNAGLTNDAIGFLHYGLVHPTVTHVQVEPLPEGEPVRFEVMPAPNVDGLVVFMAWTPPEMDRYRLAAYDEQGCVVDLTVMDAVRGPLLDEPGVPAAAREC